MAAYIRFHHTFCLTMLLRKNVDIDVLTMFEYNQNIAQMLHLTMLAASPTPGVQIKLCPKFDLKKQYFPRQA